MFKRMLVLCPTALLAAACGNDRPYPTGAPVASTATVAFSAVKFWEAGATVSWNELATDLTVAAPAPGINATRLYAELSEREIRVQARRVDPGRGRCHCQVGRQLVPRYRCADLPELDGAERHGRGGSHSHAGGVGTVGAAGRGEERGRAQHEHTFEHGACLGEMVDKTRATWHVEDRST